MDQHTSDIIERIVAEAPPLGEETREKLRVLLDSTGPAAGNSGYTKMARSDG